LFFEIFFNVSEISLPSIVVLDSKLGRDFKPDSKVFLLNEGLFLGEINKGGYIGNYYPKSKPKNTLRIALCGDSYVEGFQISTQYHFGTILKNQLQNLSDRQIEVLNFGRSGQDLRTMFIYFKEKVEKYNPDIILFFLHQSDLISEDPNLGPTLSFNKDSLMVDYSFNKSEEFLFKKKYHLLRYLATYSLLQNAFALYKSGQTSHILLDKLSPSNLFKQNKINLASITNKDVDPYYRINTAVIKELSKIDHFKNKKVIIVEIDNLTDNYKKLIIKNNISLISLDLPYNKLKKNGINPNYWIATKKYGHWNPAAHNLIGEYLSSVVKDYLN